MLSGSVANVVSVRMVGIGDGVGDMCFVLDRVHGFDGCEVLKMILFSVVVELAPA